MSNLSAIDKNFAVSAHIKRDGMIFQNVLSQPFSVHGVRMENGKFRRLPEKVAEAVSPGVLSLHTHTAGGRVRFRTDSRYIAIAAKMAEIGKMPHFALTGSAGFDMYVKSGSAETYGGSFVPPFDITDGYESVIDFGEEELRGITIDFPLYSGVNELYIGFDEKARLLEAEPYRISSPVVYYGSSITQGGCASRPGNSYQAILSRRFDCDYINLGFSGSAMAEDRMADYIAQLDMSMFVYDYDHNAPTPQHLLNTHKKLFRAVRKAKPDLPVVILSRPKHFLLDEEKQRLEIIRATFQEAVAAGDKNVCLLDGEMLTALCGNDGTVDNCHPNDYGFAAMAKAIGDTVEKLRYL